MGDFWDARGILIADSDQNYERLSKTKKGTTCKKRNQGTQGDRNVLSSLEVFFAIIHIIPSKKNVETNPFVVGKGELPMIAAHRGGGECNPENTMPAFREAVNTYGVEIIESDLYLTKDGYLVYNHDSCIDETCNVNGDLFPDKAEEELKTKYPDPYRGAPTGTAATFTATQVPDEYR